MFTRISTLISLCLLLTISCQNDPASEKGKPESAAVKERDSPKPDQTELSSEDFNFDDDASAEDFLKKYGAKNQENRIVVTTSFGEIEIELYRNTPLHRANMVYLIKEHSYFDGTWFHRVSPDHVIQAGNNDEYTLQKLRKDIGRYKITPEAINKNFHVYGSVAMARSYKKNPDKKSDPFEFYITLGQKYSDPQLSALEEEYQIKLNTNQRKLYREQGGSPHLDQEHTVIGRVVRGMKVVEEISKVETDRGEWPLNNIPIKVRIKK